MNAWLKVAAIVGLTMSCSSEKPAPPPAANLPHEPRPGLRDEILASRSLTELIEVTRDMMADQYMPNRYAALQRRDACVEVVLSWSNGNLTPEAVSDAPIVDVDEVVRRSGPVGGRTVCIEGWLREIRPAKDGAEFTLRDGRGRVSGGWLVNLDGALPEPRQHVVACGVLIGRRIQEDVVPKGLFIVGLLR